MLATFRFLALGLLAGCGSNAVVKAPVVKERVVLCPVVPSAPAVATPTAALAPSPPPAQPDVREDTAVVVAFDCFSTLEEKRTESLRAWHSGGPDRTAWNFEGAPLRCELKLKAPCAGTVTLRVLGNTKPLAKREVAVSAGDNVLEWQVPSKAWEPALDSSGKVPYSLLLISLGGLLACPTDYGGERYHFADAFMAGFSGGE